MIAPHFREAALGRIKAVTYRSVAGAVVAHLSSLRREGVLDGLLRIERGITKKREVEWAFALY